MGDELDFVKKDILFLGGRKLSRQKYKIIDEKWCFCQNSSIKASDNPRDYRFEFFGDVHGMERGYSFFSFSLKTDSTRSPLLALVT